jgi:phenylacetate-coenzyme A ligase PaaK-like adenylate-forming protein
MGPLLPELDRCRPDAAPIIFGECPEQQGMHFCAQEYIVCQLIDPDSGETREMIDGAEGELIYTLIDRECCPLLRFRTRDRITVFTGPCDCGRTSFRVRCIGRTDDMLIVLGVNVFPSAIKDVIASFRPRTTGDMWILLDKPGPSMQAPLRIQAEFVHSKENRRNLRLNIEIRDRRGYGQGVNPKNSQQGNHIFMIKHVMKAIMDVSDRILALHYGKKIGEGTQEEIASDRTVKEIYLGI